MKTDLDVLSEINTAFAGREKPLHFTNYNHCDECAEHNELLRGRDRETLSFSDVGNPGWDPICFISPQGFAFYLPALARIALSSSAERGDGYVPQLLSHLCSDGPRNARIVEWHPEERKAVAALLEHIAQTRSAQLDQLGCADQLFEALGYLEN